MLSKEDEDILKEVGTIGAGNTATSMSKMLGRKITIDVPSAKVVPITKVPEAIGAVDEVIGATVFTLEGDLTGLIMLVLPIGEFKKLAAFLINEPADMIDLDNEMAVSAVKEIGNVATGSYLAALDNFTKLKVLHSVPHFAADMVRAVLDELLIQISVEADTAVVVNTNMKIDDGGNVKGALLFIPSLAGLELIVKKLKGQPA